MRGISVSEHNAREIFTLANCCSILRTHIWNPVEIHQSKQQSISKSIHTHKLKPINPNAHVHKQETHNRKIADLVPLCVSLAQTLAFSLDCSSSLWWISFRYLYFSLHWLLHFDLQSDLALIASLVVVVAVVYVAVVSIEWLFHSLHAYCALFAIAVLALHRLFHYYYFDFSHLYFVVRLSRIRSLCCRVVSLCWWGL